MEQAPAPPSTDSITSVSNDPFAFSGVRQAPRPPHEALLAPPSTASESYGSADTLPPPFATVDPLAPPETGGAAEPVPPVVDEAAIARARQAQADIEATIRGRLASVGDRFDGPAVNSVYDDDPDGADGSALPGDEPMDDESLARSIAARFAARELEMLDSSRSSFQDDEALARALAAQFELEAASVSTPPPPPPGGLSDEELARQLQAQFETEAAEDGYNGF